MTAEATYGCPRTIAPGILLEGSCTVNGRCTWGFRLTCNGCGAVDASPISSSVASEDHPPRFAREHRDCNPARESARAELRPQDRHSRERSYLYFDAESLRDASEQAHAWLKAQCSPLQVYAVTYDF